MSSQHVGPPGSGAPKVTITPIKTKGADPEITVYNVVLESPLGGGISTETLGSIADLKTFLNGIRRACDVLGIIFYQPELPHHIE